MVNKKSWILILFILSNFFFAQLGFSKVSVVDERWKIPKVEGEHGPFYSDTLLGLIIQDGNTVDNTVAFNSNNTLVLKREILILGGHYTYGNDEAGLSSRNWDVRFRYEYKFRENINPFASIVEEGDPFAGFFKRENYDLGVNFPIHGEIFDWRFEIGYRYTEESPTADPERYQNKIRLHVGGVWKIAEKGEVDVFVRYLPFLSDTQGDLPNYMLDFGLSVKSFFSKNFYLNMTFSRNYRQVPLEDRLQFDSKLIGSIGYKI
ncbi:MAG: DUF481 domain-containing protein [Bacteriovoracales bacterium]|jgi:hypothetical protein